MLYGLEAQCEWGLRLGGRWRCCISECWVVRFRIFLHLVCLPQSVLHSEWWIFESMGHSSRVWNSFSDSSARLNGWMDLARIYPLGQIQCRTHYDTVHTFYAVGDCWRFPRDLVRSESFGSESWMFGAGGFVSARKDCSVGHVPSHAGLLDCATSRASIRDIPFSSSRGNPACTEACVSHTST